MISQNKFVISIFRITGTCITKSLFCDVTKFRFDIHNHLLVIEIYTKQIGKRASHRRCHTFNISSIAGFKYKTLRQNIRVDNNASTTSPNLEAITKTYLYNFDPFEPRFYIE